MYVLFTRYGRVGETGVSGTKTESSIVTGIKLYEKTFKAKTKKGYNEIKMSFAKDNNVSKVEEEVKYEASKLDKQVEAFVNFINDKKQMEKNLEIFAKN